MHLFGKGAAWLTSDTSPRGVHSFARDEARARLQVRAGLVLDDLVVTRSVRGAAALEGAATFQELIEALD